MVLRAGLAFALLLLATARSAAELQDPRPEERGYPLMRSFGDSEYQSGSQNFAVAADSRGHIYVGNLKGLLVWDGARFRLATNPTAVYAVAVGQSGRVIAGGPQSLLTLESSSDGSPTLRSITELLPEAERGFGDVLSIRPSPHGFLVLTDSRLLTYDGRSLRSIVGFGHESPKRLLAMGEATYLSLDRKLQRVDGSALAPAPELAALDGYVVDALIPEPSGATLAVVRDLGLVRVGPTGIVKVPGPTSEWAEKNVISSALRLEDGRLAFGSKAGGLLLANSAGEAQQFVDGARGLPDDHVGELAKDPEGGLWAALSAGLVRLDVAASTTIYDGRAGVLGGAHGVHRHAGRLYAFGSSGVGVFEGGRLRKVPGIAGSAWFGLNLPDTPGEFLVAAAAGIYRVAAGRASLVPGTSNIGAYVLADAPRLNGILVGARGGLNLLAREGSAYRLVGPFKGSPRYVRSIVVRPSGRAFCSSVFDGFVAVDFDPADRALARFTKLGGGEGTVLLTPEGPRAITIDGATQMFTIEEETPRLVKDANRTRALAGLEAWVAASDARGDLWVNAGPPRVFPWVDGKLSAEPIVLHSFPARTIQTIQAEPDGVVWVGGEQGLVRHIGLPAGGTKAPPKPAIASVTIDDGLVFDGWGDGARPPAELSPNVRRIKVGFGPLSHRPGLAYQFRLDPLDRDWSEWSARSEVEFTTLRAAPYRFRVRTRGADGQIGPEADWTFTVAPPWYDTLAARVFAALAFVAFVAGAVMLRTRALRAEAEQLGRRVEEKTVDLQNAIRELETSRQRVEEQNRLLEEANARLEDLSRHDALTGISNRRHFDAALQEEWLRARREGTSLALGLLDLDHFKAMNDAFGHPEGDEALRRVAEALGKAMRRPADMAARYGGEEFVFLLSDTDLAGALRVAEDARARVEALALRSSGGPSGKLTASVGVAAISPVDAHGWGRLVEAADAALYAAKAAGRNQVMAREAVG